MQTAVADLRYALRRLRRSPGFALGVAVVLALGIGANAALFTVLRATLLRPLPYAHSSELVHIQAIDHAGTAVNSKIVDLQAWQQRMHTIRELAYYQGTIAYLHTPADDQRVSANLVSANLFSMLGVAPQLGRTFSLQEQQPGHPVMILSDVLWRTQFRADPQILGSTVRLDDRPYTVIGVMPKGFAFPANMPFPEVWTPVELSAANLTRDFTAMSVQVIGRRAPGTSDKAITDELSAIQSTLRPLYSTQSSDLLAPVRVQVESYRNSLNERQRPALLGITAAVMVLWLISCASAASLMLARGVSRRHELAVRGALGASRWRLLRQFLSEALVLAMAGCLAGLVLAQTVLHMSSRFLARQISGELPSTPSMAVLAGLMLLTAVSTVLFGAIPALLATGGTLETAMRDDSERSGTGRSQGRLQRLLVVGELTLTLALVVSCGLLLRTVYALRSIPLGFRTDHVLVVEPSLPAYRYKGQDLNKILYRPLLERARRIPGVQSAALSSEMPLSRSFDVNFSMDMTTPGKPVRVIDAKLRAASPELKQVLGFSMAQGRWFTAQDTPMTPVVAVVNRAFARRYSDDAARVMNEFSLRLGKDRPMHVVGIMDDFHQTGVADASAPEIDLNAAQLLPTDSFYQPTMQVHVELALRTARDPESVIPELRKAMQQVDPALTVAEVRTMDQVVDDAIGSQLLMARLLESFAGLALVIALAGLYSLLSYMVSNRSRELGVRLALGAQQSDVLLLVLRSAAALLVSGVLCGVVASLISVRLLQHFLYGVHVHDAVTFSGAVVLMLCAGMLAAYLPARRAASVDPMQVLRAE